MIRLPRGFKSLLVVSFLCLTVLCLSGTAHATWYWTHGHSGHVQDPSTVTTVVPRATGLEINMYDSTAWVHYAVPTVGDATRGARLIRVRFNIVGGTDSRISGVRIYNGNVLVKSFTVNWHTEGWQTVTLDLGAIKLFPHGMGISLQLYAGPDSLTDSIIIAGAGANFVAK
ncbi:MAG TPA: hypothetical protein PK250_02965 [Syntrophobacter fumaroxidans]|nr:hypothetical protein [Syntrophobacter fumaroxidans]